MHNQGPHRNHASRCYQTIDRIDSDAIPSIAASVRTPTVCAFARTRKGPFAALESSRLNAQGENLFKSRGRGMRIDDPFFNRTYAQHLNHWEPLKR
jgi:hypothetical protein